MAVALFLTLVAFIAINCIGFVLIAIDHRRAYRLRRRISEWTLLQVALLGGWLGCYAGQTTFRHKPRQRAFSAVLAVGAVGNLLLFGATIGWLRFIG